MGAQNGVLRAKLALLDAITGGSKDVLVLDLKNAFTLLPQKSIINMLIRNGIANDNLMLIQNMLLARHSDY